MFSSVLTATLLLPEIAHTVDYLHRLSIFECSWRL
jgi:hypothetical protein